LDRYASDFTAAEAAIFGGRMSADDSRDLSTELERYDA
jgi:hypothetical protein